ncbi:hypothetical protein CCP3SC5AM1_1490004 [Gammaproteobacteria bacterium]
MIKSLLKTLICELPRYAEEEGYFYSVSRDELINVLCSQQSVDKVVAVTTIELVENLLDTLAVLNSDYLQKGEWCFISFPAQLLAMSVLTAMSDKSSRFFVDNFWNTNSIDNARKEEQRLPILQDFDTRSLDYGCPQSRMSPPQALSPKKTR